MAFIPLASPVDITPGIFGSYTDIDVSAYVSSEATGIAWYFVTKNWSTSSTYGVRANGSTDSFMGTLITSGSSRTAHVFGFIGIDSNGIFEGNIPNAGVSLESYIYLLGYYEDETVFMTNAIDKSLGSTGSYVDIDISGDITVGDEPVMAMFQTVFSTNARNYNLRMNGSTDDYYSWSYYRNNWGYIIGVDENFICEGKIEHTEVDFYLTGYHKSGVTVNTNAVDQAVSNDGNWHDVSSMGAGGIFDIRNVAGSGWTIWGLRPDGYIGGYPTRRASARHLWAMMGAVDEVIEAITITTKPGVESEADFYLIATYDVEVVTALYQEEDDEEMNLGSWKIDDYLTFSTNAHNVTTGAASDADAEPTYRIYKDETAPPLLNGTLSILDNANTTGFYTERVQLTSANGFEKGKCYTIYIEKTVNAVMRTEKHIFQIGAEVNVGAVWDELKADHVIADSFGDYLDIEVSSRLAPTVASRTLDITANGNAGIDWANIDNQSTEAILSNTTTSLVYTVFNQVTARINAIGASGGYTNLTAKSGSNFKLFFDNAGADTTKVVDDVGTGGGASAGDISAEAIADAVWDELFAEHVAVGSYGLQVGKMTFDENNYIYAVPQDIAPTVINTIVDATWDELRSAHVVEGSFGEGVIAYSLATQAKADVNEQADLALTDIRLNELISLAQTAKPVANSFIDYMFNKGVNQTFDRSTDSLEAIKDSQLGLTAIIDGTIDVQSILKRIHALLSGNGSSREGDIYTYKQANGSNYIRQTISDAEVVTVLV